MPDNKNGIQMQMPQDSAPDNEWKDEQFPFDGTWMPSVDPALIGPTNFATLQNLRYNEKSLEGVSGYTKYNDSVIHATINDINAGIQLRVNKDLNIPSYVLAHTTDGAGNDRVYVNTTAVNSQGAFSTTYRLDTSGAAYDTDIAANLTPRFSSAPQGSVVYCNGRESKIFAGQESKVAAVYVSSGTDDSAASIFDYTDEITKATTTDTCVVGPNKYMLIFSTRPLQGIKAYVSTSSGSGHSVNVKYWNGSAFAAVTGYTDNTSHLTTTGTITWTHTVSVAKPYHYQELYLYCYLVEQAITASSTIYHITCDTGFQDLVDVWDGVYRQPITCQKWDGTAFADYTLYVNEPSSDFGDPIGAELGQLAAGAGDGTGTRVELAFDDPQTAFKFQMIAGKIQTNAATIKTYYWNGNSYAATATPTDGTSVSSKSFNQTGLVTFQPPSATALKKRTKFGVNGYFYCLEWSAQLSGSAVDDIVVDLITGVPAQENVNAFKWSTQFNGRLMLGDFDEGREGNRMDFCVTNAPDVFNGNDSSMRGIQSLYYGGSESINGAASLYNRFGASVYSMLLVFKDTELYLLVGTDPDDFIIYPVSETVGCPAPYTIASAELGIDLGEGITRNVALWLSHSGPMMFDGATVFKIPGIDKYFEPGNPLYVSWDAITEARGWFDTLFKEYNLLIPSSGSATNDLWFVYDMRRKKWFTKSTGTAPFPLSQWSAIHTTGEQFNFAGCPDGYVRKLEVGTSWDGAGITQVLKTGDFWPSKNIWDETLIRKFKLVAKKITDSGDNELSILYYGNTSESAGSGVIFQDASATDGVYVSFVNTDDVEWASAPSATFQLSLATGTQRLVRLIQDLNRKGWSHAFEFRITTDDVRLGWLPIFWGIEYRIERKDNKAT